MFTHACRHCGEPIIFRPYIKDAKTGQLRRPVKSKVFVIHLNGPIIPHGGFALIQIQSALSACTDGYVNATAMCKAVGEAVCGLPEAGTTDAFLG